MLKRIILFVAAALALLLAACEIEDKQSEPKVISPRTFVEHSVAFAGNSDDLLKSYFTTDIETDIWQGTSVIYSPAFTRVPALLDEVESGWQFVDEQAESMAAYTPAFFAAGIVSDDFVQESHARFAEALPGMPLPVMEQFNSFVISMYDQVPISFAAPFVLDETDLLYFQEGTGKTVPVRCIGFDADDTDAWDARENVSVLFDIVSGQDHFFALDLTGSATGYQTVVAMINQKATLAETLDYLDHLTVETEGSLDALDMYDTVLIPQISFRMFHHHSEVEGTMVENQDGMRTTVASAVQVIDFFPEDVWLRSETKANDGPANVYGTHSYIFNKPFLLAVRSIDTDEWVFALWVENTELMFVQKMNEILAPSETAGH